MHTKPETGEAEDRPDVDDGLVAHHVVRVVPVHGRRRVPRHERVPPENSIESLTWPFAARLVR
jgi:hypothetical protein